ncbi:MAG: hypothetical protein WC548_03890 [Candidatus Pacearchaeota archaeon]
MIPLENLVDIGSKLIASILAISFVPSGTTIEKTLQLYTNEVRGQARQSAVLNPPKTTVIRESGSKKIIPLSHPFSYSNLTPQMVEEAEKTSLKITVGQNGEKIHLRYNIDQEPSQEKFQERLSPPAKFYHTENVSPRFYMVVPEGTSVYSNCYQLQIINKNGERDVLEAVPHNLTEISQLSRLANKIIDPNHVSAKNGNEIGELWSNILEQCGGNVQKAEQRIRQIVKEINQRDIEDLQARYPNCHIYYLDHGEGREIAEVFKSIRTGATFEIITEGMPTNGHVYFELKGLTFSRKTADYNTLAFDPISLQLDLDDNTTTNNTPTKINNLSGTRNLEGDWRPLPNTEMAKLTDKLTITKDSIIARNTTTGELINKPRNYEFEESIGHGIVEISKGVLLKIDNQYLVGADHAIHSNPSLKKVEGTWIKDANDPSTNLPLQITINNKGFGFEFVDKLTLSTESYSSPFISDAFEVEGRILLPDVGFFNQYLIPDKTQTEERKKELKKDLQDRVKNGYIGYFVLTPDDKKMRLETYIEDGPSHTTKAEATYLQKH